MSFLGIGFLIGLAGILLPILIHIFGKRRKVIQPWGAMRFLDEAKPSWKRRTIRLQDLLVLLLRIGAVALLALAFARPALKVALPPENAHEVLMIADRSLSTELSSNKNDRIFDEIVSQTEAALDALPVDTKIHFYINQTEVPATNGKPFNDPENRSHWVRQLKSTPPIADTLSWPEAIKLVLAKTDSSQSLSRQVVVIADASVNGWPTGVNELPPVWNQLLKDSIQDEAVFLAATGAKHPARKLANLAIDQIESDLDRVQTGKPVTVRATVSNRGTSASPPTQARWLAGNDGAEINQAPIPKLEPGDSHELTFRHAFPQSEVMPIQLAIDAKKDAMSIDNKAAVIVDIIDEISVAVVTDLATDQLSSSDARFACWTFAAAAGDPGSIAFGDLPTPGSNTTGKQVNPFFQLRWFTPDQLAESDLDDYPVIVWSVAESSEVDLSEPLRQYVRDGGGLWFRLPVNVDVSQFNRDFFPHEFGLSPTALSTSWRSTEDAIGIRPVDEEDTSPLAAIAFSALEELQAKRHLKTAGILPRSSQVLLEFSGGKPFVINRKLGDGQVMLTTLDSNPKSGNLAASVGYVPYVREMLWRLASSQSPLRNFKANEYIPGENVTVQTRIGTTFPTNRRAIQTPGLFFLGAPKENSPISVAPVGSESETLAITALELDRLDRLKPIDVVNFASRSDLNQLGSSFNSDTGNKTRETEYENQEIWAWLLVGLLGFLIMEILVAHQLISRRRASMR